jgi:regulator of chromosome condensation
MDIARTDVTRYISIGLGDEAPFEIKKPRKPSIFDIGSILPARSIIKLVCGGMHTVALASNGSVYTWGCNDEGALGRSGAENTPIRVDEALDIPATDISAGDSHTIAYNTKSNQVYYWGCYRVSKSIIFCKNSLKF